MSLLWRINHRMDDIMSSPGVEPGLSRPRRDILTTRRWGLKMSFLQTNNPEESNFKEFMHAQLRQIRVFSQTCARSSMVSDAIHRFTCRF